MTIARGRAGAPPRLDAVTPPAAAPRSARACCSSAPPHSRPQPPSLPASLPAARPPHTCPTFAGNARAPRGHGARPACVHRARRTRAARAPPPSPPSLTSPLHHPPPHHHHQASPIVRSISPDADDAAVRRSPRSCPPCSAGDPRCEGARGRGGYGVGWGGCGGEGGEEGGRRKGGSGGRARASQSPFS